MPRFTGPGLGVEDARYVNITGDTMTGNLNMTVSSVALSQQGTGLTTFNALPLRGSLLYDVGGNQNIAMGEATIAGPGLLGCIILRQSGTQVGVLLQVRDATNPIVTLDTFDGIVLGDDAVDSASSKFFKVYSGNGAGGTRFQITGASGNTLITSSSTNASHLDVANAGVFTGSTTTSQVVIQNTNASTTGTQLYVASASNASANNPVVEYITSDISHDQAVLKITQVGTGKVFDLVASGNSTASPTALFTDSSAGTGSTFKIDKSGAGSSGASLEIINSGSGNGIYMNTVGAAVAWIGLTEGTKAHTGATTNAMVSIGMDTVTSSGTALFVRSGANASSSNPAVHFITSSSANDQAVLKITQANTAGVSLHLDTGHLQLGSGVDVVDASSNELIKFTQTASAVNELTLANAATATNPTLSATGGDTNIGITLTPKGTGQVQTNNFKITGGGSFPAWTTNGIGLSAAAATYTDTTSTGTVGDLGVYSFGIPTIAATNALAVTRMGTLYIAGAPVAGTNVTGNDRYAIFSDDGLNRFDGNVGIGGNPSGAVKLVFRTNTTSSGAIGTGGAVISVVTYTHTNTGATGTIAEWVGSGFAGLTIARSGANTPTYTDVAGIYVTPNIAGTGVTITNNWAIWSTGNIRNDGSVAIGVATTPTARLHLGAGTATASTGPLKFTSGTKMTVAEAGSHEYDGNHRLTNVGLLRFPVGGTLFDYFADVSVGGAEADIFSSTLLANTFNANGDKITASYGGNFVTGGTELTQLLVKFDATGATTIWDSTGIAPSAGTTSWRVFVELIRVSSTVVRYTVSLNTTGATGYVYCTSGEITGLTLSSTTVLKLRGASSGVGSGAGDIVGKMGYLEFKPSV